MALFIELFPQSVLDVVRSGVSKLEEPVLTPPVIDGCRLCFAVFDSERQQRLLGRKLAY